MHRYWITFDVPLDTPLPIGTRLGVGVTARDLPDALCLVREMVFDGADLPPLGEVLEDFPFERLDANHVVPNMGPTVWRGVWSPNLGAPTR